GVAAFLLCVALTSLADAELDRVRGRRVEARDARDAPVRVDREARDHEGGIGPRLPRDEVGERALHLVEDALGDRALADLPLDGDAAHGAMEKDRHRHEERDREREEEEADPPHPSADEAIALAAHGLDRRVVATDLPAELRDVHVDGPRLDAV